MDTAQKTLLWKQFGAAIDMLENAITACPETLWSDTLQRPQFSYMVFHTLFWLDLYLGGAVEGFEPPSPFNLDELDPAALYPETPHSKAALLNYLEHGREKCRESIAGLTGAGATRPCTFRWGTVSFHELLLYNMRHVQHHAAQLNLILRQQTNDATRWVGRARKELPA